MLQLLQPIWLYAMAGILIPVLIHLWNIRLGKVLQVGSIALLKEEGKQQSRRLQLTELLLLLLRCLLIVLLAFLLAKPVWRQRPANREKGWVLLEKDRAAETYQQFQAQIDSLLQAGYTLHYFQPGFEKVSLSTALQATANDAADSTLSYWALLSALQQQRNGNYPVFLFTTNYLHRFTGARPVIDTGVHWYAYTPADSVATWQADAYTTASGKIRVKQVTSHPAGTAYTFEEPPIATAPPADTATLRITIFADTYAQDARYLKAAIDAIQQYTQRRMQVRAINQQSSLPPETDWLYWLSTRLLPDHINARFIWQYENGKLTTAPSHIITGAFTPLALYKRPQLQIADTAAITPLWRDGWGQPLLYRQQQGSATVYHFAGRLDPAWNGLPWSASFPGLLLQLLYPTRDTFVQDKRIIAAAQLQPDGHMERTVQKSAAAVNRDLTIFCWLGLMALFLAERILVWYNQKTGTHG
ncbi:hypothetical protein F0L74_02750 [Chitinophaga agrisoli]|uniref:Aerotolerance regulator N-terminal domain-containing protein n=1 Tax=Chitinophaga agrisoli TaxID=2607653 RepID=A0A5B2W2C9_9BACT|nr:BatA domain-containing protein [Chitinophaga agrisoli]KAA2244900.1 hypothetical protein F0L74_02750 [Chitinophaga agrisoli]